MIMVKVSFTESSEGIKSLAHLRSVNYEDKEIFINYITERLGVLNESYSVLPVNKIIFNYIVKAGSASDSLEVRGLVQENTDNSLNFHRFNNMNLPLSVGWRSQPYDYGDVRSETSMISKDNLAFTRFMVGSKFFEIDRYVDTMINKVKMLGSIDLSWTDTLLHDGIVQREIGKAFIYFVDGAVIVRQKVVNSKPFSTLKMEKVVKTSFVTMDVETIKINGELAPYLISAYNGTDYMNSYAQVVEGVINQGELVASFITQLSTFFGKAKTLTVYAHNLSSFDGIFLVRNLLSIGSVQPLIYNGRLISIQLRLPNGKTIIFKDSFLLLPNSLRKLCKAFNILMPKGHFPFLLNDILYKGIFPAFKYWTGISLEQYLELSKEFVGVQWSFKDEAIKYCNLDCKCLHEILTMFNQLIFSNFSLNIHSCLTLPSLAMKIYKSNFMPNLPEGVKIHQVSGQIEKDIRHAYTGGAVDVYKPSNRIGGGLFKPLYYYDVNSLYPFVMANIPMPIGLVKTFKGDIRRVNPTASGTFYCNITSPIDIQHPILQKRVETPNGMRTVAGIGSWTGWLNSNELDNAIKHGYIIEILHGHEYDTAIIFREYVEIMYALRMKYPKGHPMNYVAKLLMNSLYGKFGMSSEATSVGIYNLSTEENLVAFHSLLEKSGKFIQDYIIFKDSMDRDHVIVVKDNIINLTNSEDNYHSSDVNVAIASTITAAGRVWMSLVKNNRKFNLYYSDTDSVVIDKALPAKMVGGNLGQFKLEYNIKQAVFLAPKVYGLITKDGDEIIKVKGLTSKALQGLHIQDLDALLSLDSMKEFTQEKWFKSVTAGTINVTDVAYSLKVTNNKRQGIYVDNLFVDTIPYNYDDINN